MDMEQNYAAVVDAAKRLLRAEKDKAKKSDKYREMDIHTHTAARRAAASDRLTDACWECDKARDWMHKVLVDADLCDPKPPEAYQSREIRQSAGLGHSINFNYTPPLPERLKRDAA